MSYSSATKKKYMTSGEGEQGVAGLQISILSRTTDEWLYIKNEYLWILVMSLGFC